MQKIEYKVRSYVPSVKGCGANDMGWDLARCEDFQEFLNQFAAEGWTFHSSEYRHVISKGCGGGKGSWLVCIFTRPIP